MVGAYERLPQELKAYKQWALAGNDKAPHIADGDELRLVSVHAQELHDFDTAVALAQKFNCHIGFILRGDDPFTCIDLDVKDTTPPEVIDGYINLITKLESYTERSISGRGLHVWVRASIGQGARRDSTEVYSQERFIICTGDVYIDAPIVDRQLIIAQLAQSMKGDANVQRHALVEIESDLLDKEIIGMAMNAKNGEKFNALCRGEWSDLNYPSQSEADFALLAMLSFYTCSNAQVRRIFRMSNLGKREKATKNDRYIDNALQAIRYRQHMAQQHIEAERTSASQMMQQEVKLPPQDVQAVPHAIAANQPPENPMVNGIDWPPGMVGAIASFIYHSAPRPVKEVAIVAALGLIAGMCGKTYHVTQSGLNIYLILVARSAIGKEAMHSGISLLISKMRDIVPMVGDFVDFADFVSGPALVKACAKKPCFLNVAGEWGRKLAKLSQDRTDSPTQQLRTVMTNLYQKSGPTSIVGGLSYSNRDQNVDSVAGVAYSMIGETTPGTFNESLTKSMMEDGFLSRFTILEYRGDRPPANPRPINQPDQNLLEALCSLASQSLTLLQSHQYREVQFAPDAWQCMAGFDLQCDKEINATRDESRRQMWNRAHLKAMRIAGLLAVADNWIAPIIQLHHAEWALTLVKHDIELMNKKLDAGDIGDDDDARDSKLISVCKDYLKKPVANSYAIPEDMRRAGIIPRRYIQLRIQQVSSFYNHRMGANFAMDQSLRALVDGGVFAEVPKDEVVKYSFHGKCYRIVGR